MTMKIRDIVKFFLRDPEAFWAHVGKRRSNKLRKRYPRKKRVFWDDQYERWRMRNFWGDVTKQKDFPEKFVRLTSGLDAKSVETVIRILMRHKRIVSTRRFSLDLYTREEQEALCLLYENFDSEIMEISENLFAWRNYLLPKKSFQDSVFYYRYGLPTLKTAGFVKGKAVIDAGAYIGDSALVLSELNPSAIYLFEPDPENFSLLKQTLDLNHIANAVPENMALGAESSEMTLKVAGGGLPLKYAG